MINDVPTTDVAKGLVFHKLLHSILIIIEAAKINRSKKRSSNQIIWLRRRFCYANTFRATVYDYVC